MRIAVIGAGISGLVCAYQAHRVGHDVHVFEAGAYAGGHTNTIRVDEPDATLDVDTGFIVFNDRNYPNFERLLKQLKVAWQPSDMSFGVGDERGDFEYASTSPNALYAKRAHLASPAFHRMVLDVRRFQREARALLASDDDPSLAEWLDDRDFGPAFVERLIVPQAAAVWSADPEQMWSFPARFLVEFFDHHGMLDLRDRPQWRVIRGGSKRYVEALTAPFADRIRLRTPVRSVVRADDHVTVDGERFDRVVLATHADQTLAILGDDATPRERELLSAFPYAPNEAVLHHDRGMLPRRRRAWASWNYHLLDAPPGKPTVTYHMNRLQSLRQARRQWCVTLNRTEAIDPDAIVRTIQYAHPVFTREGMAAQGRVAEISGDGGAGAGACGCTHFAGAYWGWGFHEDGVVSGLRVARELGIDVP